VNRKWCSHNWHIRPSNHCSNTKQNINCMPRYLFQNCISVLDCLLLSFLYALSEKVVAKLIIFLGSKWASFPVALWKLYRTISNIFALHFFKSLQEILRIKETHKPKSFGFLWALVPNNSSPWERGKFFKGIRKHIISHFISKIATKDSIVIVLPQCHIWINPDFTCWFTHWFQFKPLFFFFLQQLSLRFLRIRALGCLACHCYSRNLFLNQIIMHWRNSSFVSFD